MFPEPSFTGCSFNTSLYRAIGEAIADDARIFNNNGNAGLTFWSPNVNPFRDPRWGRGQEVAGGEDPFAISMYARQFVRGLQEGEDPRYLKVSSCCKHFVAYDLESWNGTGRDAYNAVVSDADLAEYYTPTFQTCVQDARVSSLMCSYNALNGVPTCASSFLLTEIARGEWGFNGSVTARARARVHVARASFRSPPACSPRDRTAAGTSRATARRARTCRRRTTTRTRATRRALCSRRAAWTRAVRRTCRRTCRMRLHRAPCG